MKYSMIVAALMCAAIASAQVPVRDDCADCHDAAPVSKTHAPVSSLSVAVCIDCHAAKPGDPFVRAVHQRHIDQGFDCVDCHTGRAPERKALDALLKPGLP